VPPTATQPIRPTSRLEEDGFVVSSDPYGRFGQLDSLRLGHGLKETRSFLKFTVSGLPSAPAKATLRLFAFDGGPAGGSLYPASNFVSPPTAAWTDDGLKWATQPDVFGLPLATLGGLASGSWAEYDVTSAIRGNGTYSFGLVSTGTDALGFHSSESTSLQPELVIVP
jgi:hypothetical protein